MRQSEDVRTHFRVRSCAIFATISAAYVSTNSRLMTWSEPAHKERIQLPGKARPCTKYACVLEVTQYHQCKQMPYTPANFHTRWSPPALCAIRVAHRPSWSSETRC
jgi:hypothetical protein